MGLSRPYPRSRVHSPDRRGALRGCLHDQLAIECLPRHPRSGLRPTLRTRLPSRPGGKGAGGDLPAEARVRRLEGRHPWPPAASGEIEWQAHSLCRRRAGIADGGARSGGSGLPGHGIRQWRVAGRHDAQPDPEVPPARRGHRRGVRLHHRPGRGNAIQPVGRQPARAHCGGLGRGFRRYGCAARPGCADSGTAGSRQAHSHRDRLAGQCGLRPYDEDSEAGDRTRRWQYRHGLLPVGATPWWRGRQGHRAQRLRGNEGFALGKGRGHPRRHPHRQHAGAQGVPPRQWQTHRRPVRDRACRIRCKGPSQPGSDRRARRVPRVR
jgi:hypothetical protein